MIINLRPPFKIPATGNGGISLQIQVWFYHEDTVLLVLQSTKIALKYTKIFIHIKTKLNLF